MSVSRSTFKQVADMWIEKERPVRSDGWVRNAKHLLHDYARDLADLPPVQITPNHVHAALKSRLAEAPEQTNRARRYIKTVLDYAAANDYRPRGMINPAQWDGLQEHKFPKQPKKGRRHHAAPHYREVPSLVQETRKHEERSVGAVALRFAFYTGKRTTEVLKARWSEIDPDNKIWTIPPERMQKNDEGEHQVPLPDQAMEILRLRETPVGAEAFTSSPATILGSTWDRMAWRGFCVVWDIRAREQFTVRCARHSSNGR